MVRFFKIIVASIALAATLPVLANSASLAGDEGVTDLRWRSGTIRIAISASMLREGPNIKSDSDVTGAIRRSLETWSRIANVEFVQVTSDRLSASPTGPSGDGVSLITSAPTAENALLFAKDREAAAATTRIFYNRRGFITEADIVLNPYQQFSTDGTFGTFDLESTLTHEIGHLIGLPHSSVLGSTMHAHYGKNGVFGLQNFSPRTLSFVDVAAVRRIYGGGGEDDACCGVVAGRVLSSGKVTRSLEIWIEDSLGRIHGAVTTGPDGIFTLAGLNAGKYSVFAQENSGVKSGVAAQEVGEVIVTAGETTEIKAKLRPVLRDLELSYLGFNGQLSEMAVAVTAGRSYVVYLAGPALDPRKLAISVNSPHLTVNPASLRSLDYGDEISVVSFEIRVSATAPKGEYAIIGESSRGDKHAILGALTIDSFLNPWFNFASLDD